MKIFLFTDQQVKKISIKQLDIEYDEHGVQQSLDLDFDIFPRGAPKSGIALPTNDNAEVPSAADTEEDPATAAEMDRFYRQVLTSQVTAGTAGDQSADDETAKAYQESIANREPVVDDDFSKGEF